MNQLPSQGAPWPPQWVGPLLDGFARSCLHPVSSRMCAWVPVVIYFRFAVHMTLLAWLCLTDGVQKAAHRPACDMALPKWRRRWRGPGDDLWVVRGTLHEVQGPRAGEPVFRSRKPGPQLFQTSRLGSPSAPSFVEGCRAHQLFQALKREGSCGVTARPRALSLGNPASAPGSAAGDPASVSS